MNMRQCARGHFYDAEKMMACPYCAPGAQVGLVRTLETDAVPAFPRTQPLETEAVPPFPQTRPLPAARQAGDLVCGWLVCTEGGKRGRDFRLHAGENTIGRAASNDICLDFDDSLSLQTLAVIAFDARNQTYCLQHEQGSDIFYLNGQALHSPTQLQSHDQITVGGTSFLFLPLCSDRFAW